MVRPLVMMPLGACSCHLQGIVGQDQMDNIDRMQMLLVVVAEVGMPLQDRNSMMMIVVIARRNAWWWW